MVISCLLPRGCCKSIFLAMLLSPVAAYDQVMRIEEYLHAFLSCFVSLSLRDSEIFHGFVPFGRACKASTGSAVLDAKHWVMSGTAAQLCSGMCMPPSSPSIV